MIGKRATYIYIERIIEIFFGYIFWLFLSRLTTPDVIGISSTVISLTVIFSIIADLGISTGSTRFLGRSFSHKSRDTKVLVKASLLIVGSCTVFCSIGILVFKDFIYPTIGTNLVIISILLIGTSVITHLSRSILIASLETKSLPKIMIISSLCKIILTTILILLGMGAVGIVLGYLAAYVSAVLLLSFRLVSVLKPIEKEAAERLYSTVKSITVASLPSWIPIVIGTLGSQLGIIMVFGIEGPSQAAFYFIAFSIFIAIDALRSSLFAIAFPTLSAMDNQRKRFVSRLIKMSLVLSLPISSTIILYSEEILGLIGPEYAQASIPLRIMLLCILTFTVNSGISILVYSYGKYWQVLSIGLSTNVTRIILYFIFVPLYGSTGAALSFVLGSVFAFAVSIMIAKRHGMMIFFKELSLLFTIPTALAFTLDYLNIKYVIMFPVVVLISLMFFYFSGIVSKSDIRDTLDILPNNIRKPFINILNKFQRSSKS